MPKQAEKLVTEFRDVIGLEAVDASRSAFTALAVSKGWTKARIGRYLGISRARVGQKVDKLEHYALTQRVPVLTATLKAAPSKATAAGSQGVAFTASDWQDDQFATGMLQLVD